MNLRTKLIHYLAYFLVIFATSCGGNNTPEFPIEPELTLISATGNKFHFTSDTSAINFKFSLVDGDKDMGIGPKDSVIIFEDIRSDSIYQKFYLGLPNIPRETIDGPTLKATIDVPLKAFNFVPRSDTVHLITARDTLVFRIYVKDDAGNHSNIVTSDTIYILP